MAWDTTLVTRLRYMIHDLDPSNYTWTDSQLKTFIAIAAVYTFEDLSPFELDYGGPYTVDTDIPSISPDPVSTPIISNIILLKAACIIATSELKKANASGGWKIVDDRSTIDGTQNVKSAKEIADNYCKSYTDAFNAYLQGNTSIIQAILSPYTDGSIWLGGNDSYYRGRQCP